jgi:hypothetical protein
MPLTILPHPSTWGGGAGLPRGGGHRPEKLGATPRAPKPSLLRATQHGEQNESISKLLTYNGVATHSALGVVCPTTTPLLRWAIRPSTPQNPRTTGHAHDLRSLVNAYDPQTRLNDDRCVKWLRRSDSPHLTMVLGNDVSLLTASNSSSCGSWWWRPDYISLGLTEMAPPGADRGNPVKAVALRPPQGNEIPIRTGKEDRAVTRDPCVGDEVDPCADERRLTMWAHASLVQCHGAGWAGLGRAGWDCGDGGPDGEVQSGPKRKENSPSFIFPFSFLCFF